MVNWKGLWKYPEAGREASLPFRFQNYGTFAGPQYGAVNYDYDTQSQEGSWHIQVPGDYAFKNYDLGAYLFNNETNYVGFHCDGVSTAQMTLEASFGNIPIFNVFADRTNITGDIFAVGNITAMGNIISHGFFQQRAPMDLVGIGDVASFMQTTRAIASSKKSFDISHPSKEGHRLRYICLEGPEAEVYLRGRLKDKNVIELPEVWKDLVDPESISVSLTPIGVYQELFMEKLQWGTKIIIKNNLSGPINCSYVVYGTRKDTERNIPENKGLTPADYPGDNGEYTINGQ